MSALSNQPAPVISFEVEADHVHGDAQYESRDRDCHLVLEGLEEPRQLLVDVVGVNGVDGNAV